MNAFQCIGTFVADPEVRTFSSGTERTSFRLAINERYKKDGQWEDRASFVEFEAWGKQGKTIAEYFKKGDRIVICDSIIKQDNWEDKTTGQKRSKLYFSVQRFEFMPLSGKKNGEKSQRQEETAPASADNDNDIPF